MNPTTMLAKRAAPCLAPFSPPLWFVLLWMAVASASTASAWELPIRVAVAGTGEQGVDDLLTAAAIHLADDSELQLLDRENVARVIAEQRMALSGWVDPVEAVRIGKLLSAQLFAVVDASGAAPDVVIFAANTGARIWDEPLKGETLDQRALNLARGLKQARRKFLTAPSQLKTVSLLTVRNADLPRSYDSLCQAAGRWLERELVHSPDIIVLERMRMRQLSDERKLPTAELLPDLWTSLRLIELELARADGDRLRATARVTGSDGNLLATVKAEVAAKTPLSIAPVLARKLEQKFEAKPSESAWEPSDEAARFLRESQLFQQHKEFDRAVVAAEAAHALTPQDDRILRWLAWTTGMAATERIDPGRSTSGGPPRHAVTAEALASSLPVGERALQTLSELFIRQARSSRWPKDAQSIPHSFLRIYLGKIASLPGLSAQQQDEVDSLLAAYRSFLNDTVWPACRTSNDSALAYRNATSTLSGWIVLDQFSTLSRRRDDWAADLAGMLIDWAAIADRQLAAGDPLDLRVADYLLSNLRHKQQHSPLTPTAYKSLRRAHDVMGSKDSPLLRLRGVWLGLSLDQIAASKPETRDVAPDLEETFAKIHAKLRDVESRIVDKDTPPHLRNIWIELAHGSHQQFPSEKRMLASRRFCEFLIEHEIYHERVLDQGLLRLAHGDASEQRAALSLMKKTLELLKRTDEVDARQRAQAVRKVEGRMASLMSKLTPTPVRTAPWSSARTIVDLQQTADEYRAIVRPAIVGRRVAALGMKFPDDLDGAGEVQLTLLTFSLDDDARVEGGSLSVSDLPTRAVIERSTKSGSAFVPTSLVIDGWYLAGTNGKGIFRYRLDASKSVQVMDGKLGLPSNYVQQLASDGERIYAWLGKQRSESYLVSCHPDGSDLTVHISSRRAGKRSPLDDATPKTCRWMIWDASKKRLVFHIIDSGGGHGSIWQFTPKSGEYQTLQKFGIEYSHPPRKIDSNRILLYDRTQFTTAPQADNVAALFDLRNHTIEDIYLHDHKQSRMGVPFTIVGDTIWQAAPWGALSAEDAFEPFPPLREVAREFDFQPGAFCEPVGENEMLLGDNRGLWLLKFNHAIGKGQ